MPSGFSSLAALDHKFVCYDKEWKLHKLPKEDINVPRDHLPDPEAESIPSTKQDLTAERRWNDTGLNRLRMGPHTAENN